VIAGFCYHFWTVAMPRLKRYAKNDDMRKILENVTDEKAKEAIVKTYKAIEGFVMFSIIGFGLLQMGALLHHKEINACPFRWLRTKRNEVPSEATTADFLRKTIFNRFHFSTDLGIARFIQAKQMPSVDNHNDNVA
jgi:hypothetical protein